MSRCPLRLSSMPPRPSRPRASPHEPSDPHGPPSASGSADSLARRPRPVITTGVLVADDDPAMVGAITAIVGTEGHEVVTAYDGTTAIRRWREERPDVILLDLAMAGMDGARGGPRAGRRRRRRCPDHRGERRVW